MDNTNASYLTLCDNRRESDKCAAREFECRLRIICKTFKNRKFQVNNIHR